MLLCGLVFTGFPAARACGSATIAAFWRAGWHAVQSEHENNIKTGLEAATASHGVLGASALERPWPRWVSLGFWLILALFWFAGLGYRDLIHPDEGRYAELARAMWQSGDWITPRLNGFKYFEKPPLQYWMTALAFTLAGPSAWAARLWPALSGFAVVGLLAGTATREWGRAAGRATALVAVSMFWIFGNAHFLTLDMGLCFSLTLALCAAIAGLRPGGRASQRSMMVLGLALGLAFLAKGLVGWVIPLGALIGYSLWLRDASVWWRLRWWTLLAVLLAVAGPWVLVVSGRNPEFASFFFVHEHFARFLTTEHRRAGPLWYFFPVLALGLLPWLGSLGLWLASLRDLGRRFWLAWGPARQRPAALELDVLLWAWAGFVLVFFSVSGSKLPSYILPMFPAMALLLGPRLVRVPWRQLSAQSWSQALLFLGLAAGLAYRAKHGAQGLETQYLPVAAAWVALAGCVLLLAAWWAHRHWRLASLAAVACATLGPAQMAALNHQILAPEKSAQPWLQQLQAQGLIGADTAVYCVGYYDQTLPFYLGRPVTLVHYVDEFELGQGLEPGRAIATLAEFKSRWQGSAQALAWMTPQTYARLQAEGWPMTLVFSGERRVVVRR